MNALSDANTRRGGTEPPHAGLTSNVSPEAQSSHTGVSVGYIREPGKQWFVLRVSYGRAAKAQELLKNNSVDYYFPMRHVMKLVNNSKKRVLEPLLPNFIFAHTTEDNAESLVKETCGNGILSYYYNHFKINQFGKNPPLTINHKSMMSFIKATSVDNDHVCVVDERNCRYKSGDKVIVTDGEFKGVEGKVARVAGQQRVIIELEGLCLIATAYIPTAFLRIIDAD